MLRKVHIRLIVFILGTVLALGASPTNVLSVQSTVLYTAPHETTGSTNSLACMIINVSDEPRDVTVEIINTYGDVVKTDEITLEPGPRHKTVQQFSLAKRPSYCKFTAEGTASDFRAHVCTFKPFVGCLSTSEALPRSTLRMYLDDSPPLL